MGKRNKPPGIPKEGRKKQRQEIETRALLLGAVYDKATSMLIKTEIGEHGGVATNWTTYYDVMGRELPLKEAKRRIREADTRLTIDKRHPRYRTPKPTVYTRKWAMPSKLWSEKLAAQAAKVTPEVIGEWVDEMDSLDTVRVVNRSVLVTNNVSKT